ncbi:MAG: PfkB family carbohydrate kinase, partial [Acidobacteriota bacterium]
RNSVDIVAVIDGYPAAGSKQQLDRFVRLPGGETATALVACARQGFRARYVGRFGDDEWGALSSDSLRDEGVDVANARAVAGAQNQFSLILVDRATGERTVLSRRDDHLAMSVGDVPMDVVRSGRMLLLDGYEPEPAAAAARAARLAGIPTVMDVEQVRPGTTEMLGHIDAIIAAEAFPAALTGYDDVGRALEAMADEFRAPIVAVTLGADGSLARCGGHEFRTPAFPTTCVDTTGAGDAFRGGFAAFCLAYPAGTVEEALAYANATAALNCRALGARTGLPTRGEVAHLVSRRAV